MKTGIVILNYNDSDNTISMIEQIKDYKSLSSIVVVDNCSTDDSLEKLNSYVSEKVVLLTSSKNKGYGAGNNIGLHYLLRHSFDFVIISNPDIVVLEAAILKMQDVMKEQKQVSFLGPVIMERGRMIRGWKFPSYFVEVLGTIPFFQRFTKKFYCYPDSYYLDYITKVEAIHGSFFMARLDDFKKIDFFDENVFLYYEENILGKKALTQHLSVYVDNEVFVTHALSMSVDKSLHKIKKYKILKQSMFYYEKYYNHRGFISLFFLRIVYFFSLIISYFIFWI